MEFWGFARETPPTKKENGIDTGVASVEKIFFTRSNPTYKSHSSKNGEYV